MNRMDYSRRPTSEAHIGGIAVGGDNPVRVQSMTNTPTLDTGASVEQCAALAAAGAEIIRLTAQGVAHARNLGNIRRELRARGIDTPLVADIHFNPAAAFAAAEEVEKVRINPGNFIDPGRTFKHLEYTDEEYHAELERLRDKLVPLLDLCRERGTALRIGVNHGSLSDRIMSRYGDTPAGMVESAMEFLRVCRDEKFNDVVISIKASNVLVMTETVRRLVAAMDAEGMHYPLHLGVTEAGNELEGRIKSAVGIGSLLVDGIGDTIRVSLSEDPVAEIPVARLLRDYVGRISHAAPTGATLAAGYNPIAPARRSTRAIENVGGTQPPVAVGVDYENIESLPAGVLVAEASPDTINPIAEIRARMHALMTAGDDTPVVIRRSYPASMAADEVAVVASVELGTLLLDGFADGIAIEAPSLSAEQLKELSLGILQATRLRFSRTEYIACPGCGRTLFDLQNTLAEIKKATSHLTGLKIGVMGCIVNGPGEMADADYGYVGAAAGNVSLYKNKECVVKNIPAAEALPRLISLIKENGDWKDAQE
ncbi:MAG: (E)-4-hydroxy-3-methylbut-2-enyl-diphosphate synthase [Muribaculaceae bacterium]|nr:(E)-4-hydroxy-3-methylbut-2-enyl-diphosphate synthase [Muribaculaceae bacterium]